jgi:hypothetical protein
MGLTEKAIAKLNEKQKHYIETCSCMINQILKTRSDNDQYAHESLAKFRGKMRGYLSALVDMNCIGQMEMRALYLFYATVGRCE